MLVESIKHGQAVLERLRYLRSPGRRWLVLDTETVAKPGYHKDDALIIGRADIIIFSAAYLGESYSFPTNLVNPKYPIIQEWMELFAPVFQDAQVTKVMHNANYDLNVFHYSGGVPLKSIWDTMIGCWKAEADIEKGLKSRASLYGRHLAKTSVINFGDLARLSLYAEEDVIQTDEIYQMQVYGYIKRPEKIRALNNKNEQVYSRQLLPAGKIVIPDEDLDEREKLDLKLQEFPYLHATVRAERVGFTVDVELLRKLRAQAVEKRDEVLRKIYKIAGKKLNLNSGKQLGALFKTLGIRSTVKTKKGAESFGAEAMFFLEGSHEIISFVQEYKSLEKMQTVYLGNPEKGKRDQQLGLEYYVSPKTGAIHASANTVGAVTGRGSSSNPNLQQLPSAKDTFNIRKCFIAPNGYALVVLDFGQLELRIGANYSRDPAMCRILNDPKGDIHQYTADEFGVDRQPTAKNINFGLLFGGGGYMLSRFLTLRGVPTDKHQGAAYRARYDEVYYRIDEWRKELVEEHRQNGFVRLFTGRKRRLLNIDWDNQYALHKVETVLANNVVQGAGQDFLKATVIRADYRCINPDREVPKRMVVSDKHRLRCEQYADRVDKARKLFKSADCKFLLQVHDEGIWQVRSEAAEEVGNALVKLMVMRHYFPTILPYSVPLVAEGGWGKSWHEAKSKDNKNKLHAGL